MPSTVPAVKAGLRDYLKVYPGLTAADGVVVRSAPGTPDEEIDKHVILGDVVAPQKRVGLAGKDESPTMTCWARITRPGSDEDAIDTAREDAAALLALVQAAIKADESAGGAVPGPGGLMISETALEEYATDIDGTAARRADYRFTITWTSHLA